MGGDIFLFLVPWTRGVEEALRQPFMWDKHGIQWLPIIKLLLTESCPFSENKVQILDAWYAKPPSHIPKGMIGKTNP